MTVSPNQKDNSELVSIAADIVSAYVSNNPVPVADLPKLIGEIHAALKGIDTPAAEPVVKAEPAISLKKSVTPDYIICLEDGKKFKSLKRHLGTHYNLTPDEYRHKWGLPADYPMVAPNYAAARSAMAKAVGLGRKPAAPVTKAKPATRVAASAIPQKIAKSPVKTTHRAAPKK